MTQTQAEFERKEKRKRFLIQISRIATFLSFLILWEFAGRKGMINTFIFSSPSRLVIQLLKSVTKDHLMHHIMISLIETLFSFCLIMLGSILIACILWRCHILAEILEPVFITLNSLPKSALAPLFIVWLGTGFKTIVIAGISVAIFGCIMNLYAGFKCTDEAKQNLIKTMGGTHKDIFFYVIIPANKDTIFSNMKVNIGLSLVGVMIGEFLAARKGLGYLIIYSSQVFHLDMLILCILILCIIAILLYGSICLLERKFNR